MIRDGPQGDWEPFGGLRLLLLVAVGTLGHPTETQHRSSSLKNMSAAGSVPKGVDCWELSLKENRQVNDAPPALLSPTPWVLTGACFSCSISLVDGSGLKHFPVHPPTYMHGVLQPAVIRHCCLAGRRRPSPIPSPLSALMLRHL